MGYDVIIYDDMVNDVEFDEEYKRYEIVQDCFCDPCHHDIVTMYTEPYFPCLTGMTVNAVIGHIDENDSESVDCEYVSVETTNGYCITIEDGHWYVDYSCW